MTARDFLVPGHPVGDAIPQLGNEVKLYLGACAEGSLPELGVDIVDHWRDNKMLVCAEAGVDLQPVGDPRRSIRRRTGRAGIEVIAQYFVVTALNPAKFRKFGLGRDCNF